MIVGGALKRATRKEVRVESIRLAEQKCPDGQCLWEDVGEKRFEPRYWFFGLKKKVWRSARCCGTPMAQMNEVQMRRCKCGHREETILNECIALCHRCGRHRIHPAADYDM